MRKNKLIFESILHTFTYLSPHIQFKNPVMFVTYLGAIFTTLYITVYNSFSLFNIQIALWLWFTLLFANFAQSLAESRGKAQVSFLKDLQTNIIATKLRDGQQIKIPAHRLVKGDVIICNAKDIIPTDGEVVQGLAMVDESAITGESAPVIRESGGDRSAVTAGTMVVSDSLTIRVTAEIGNSFLDKIIHLIEGTKRKKTPNEMALNIVLVALTIIFLLVVISLKQFANFTSLSAKQELSSIITLPVLISLFVCLIPTTISSLLSSIGIAGMNRLIKLNVVAKSGRSVEAAGDIDMLMLDKTGTITMGNRMAVEFLPAEGIEKKELARLAHYASISDETPEGRSVIILSKRLFGFRPHEFDTKSVKFIPFSARTRMSGIDFINNKGQPTKSIRKGAVDSIKKHAEDLGGILPRSLKEQAESISRSGGTPLLISDDKHIIGIIHLKDVLKGGIKKRFLKLKRMGIKTIMVTGDNHLTAAAIAAEAGVDDFIAEATPEAKLERIKEEQKNGHMVAMAGDGTNDAPAIAQADVGVAMNTGSQASREAGNMVDLDSNPTKLIEIVEIGKELLMTRGALTTFSIANDIAKYFAIIPALFGSLYSTSAKGPLSILNMMSLQSSQSAILSAVIFNAIVIVLLIPVAIRGVRYKAQTAYRLLTKNVLIYGLGGIVAPFFGIKLVDLIINFLRLV